MSKKVQTLCSIEASEEYGIYLVTVQIDKEEYTFRITVDDSKKITVVFSESGLSRILEGDMGVHNSILMAVRLNYDGEKLVFPIDLCTPYVNSLARKKYWHGSN